jgi:hydroxyacylglutathione hydrolase
MGWNAKMILRHFLLDVNETNCYLVACPETREAAIIDPGEPCRELEALVEEEALRPVFVVVTHDHFDHTGGVSAVVSRFGVRGRGVREGDSLKVGNLEFTVLETPGHTPDSISLAVRDAIFTGDALFAGSVGGTTSQENFEQEIDHIRSKILSHSRGTRLFPGHGPPSTVAIEATFNPFL